MPHLKLLIGLFVFVLLAVSSAAWLSAQRQQEVGQQQLRQLAEQLSVYLQAQPAYEAELISLSQSVSSLRSLSIRLSEQDGTVSVVAGLTTDNLPQEKPSWSLHQLNLLYPLSNGRQLQLSALSSGFPWIWLVMAIFGYVMLVIGYLLRERLLRQRRKQFWQMFPVELQPEGHARLDRRQLESTLRRLVMQYDRAVQTIQSQQQQLQTQQTAFSEQQHEWGCQISQTLHRNLHLSRDLRCWQLLNDHAGQMKDVELRQWFGLLQWRQQPVSASQPTVQGVSHWFAHSLRDIQQSWPSQILLLPDEDPASTRYQMVGDTDMLRKLLFALLQGLQQLIEGHELLVGYRIETGIRDKLLLKIQYTGRSISARSRQILQEGGLAEPSWTDIPFELTHHLLESLSGDIQIEELADLGTRLILSIPVVGQQKPQGKRFQNLAVYDPRRGRLEIWRQSLLGVSEQVVAAGTLNELMQVLQSRLIDTVVMHLHQDDVSETDMAHLHQISQRHQLVLFAPQDLLHGFSASLPDTRFGSPLLLADLQDLPQPGSQFANQQLLIVDDNPTNLSFVRAMLAGQGVSIDFAMTGHDALKMASNSRYQLILMDIQLPDLSGIEVTKRIRQLRHHQQTVILAFTGHALPEEAASFRLAGMDDVMIKPMDARKLAHILSRIRPVAEIQ